MKKWRRLKAVPDYTPERHRSHEEWCESLRVRQAFGRIATATMVAAYLDKDWRWIEQFFMNAGEPIPEGLTGDEYYAAQSPVFDALFMGELPTDEQLEIAKNAGIAVERIAGLITGDKQP